MNRTEFIKKFFGTGALLFFPFNFQKKNNVNLLLNFEVRGFQYYHGAGLIQRMKAGERLKLLREPSNPYDIHAIAVYYHDEKIGFVPREKNEVLSRLLDSGMSNIAAEIIKVRRDEIPWNAVSATIFLESYAPRRLHEWRFDLDI